MQRIIRSQFQNAVRLISIRGGLNLQKIIGATKTVEECTRVPLRHVQRPTPKLQDKPPCCSGAALTNTQKSCANEDVILCAYPPPGREEASVDACCQQQETQCEQTLVPNLMSTCPQPEGKWETENKNMKYTIRFLAGLVTLVGTIIATKDTIYPYDIPFK